MTLPEMDRPARPDAKPPPPAAATSIGVTGAPTVPVGSTLNTVGISIGTAQAQQGREDEQHRIGRRGIEQTRQTHSHYTHRVTINGLNRTSRRRGAGSHHASGQREKTRSGATPPPRVPWYCSLYDSMRDLNSSKSPNPSSRSKISPEISSAGMKAATATRLDPRRPHERSRRPLKQKKTSRELQKEAANKLTWSFFKHAHELCHRETLQPTTANRTMCECNTPPTPNPDAVEPIYTPLFLQQAVPQCNSLRESRASRQAGMTTA